MKLIRLFLLSLCFIFATGDAAFASDEKTYSGGSDLGDCIKVVSKQWGSPCCSQCPGSTDAFMVVYKNVCSDKMDVVIGLGEPNKKWKYIYREGVKPGDTIAAYTCTGTSKSQMEFRKSGTKEHLITCEEMNAEYIKATGKKPCIVETSPKQTEKLVDISAKLLHGEKKKEPLANQKVSLKDQKGASVQTSTTDQFGDFNFTKVMSEQPVSIVLEDNPNLSKDEKIYLAKQNGIIIGEMSSDRSFKFKFELLPQDIVTLSKIEDEDPFLQLIDFKKSGRKEIMITDMVYYKQDSWEIEPDAKIILDKVVKNLKNNPDLKVEVMSHSDSRGDDASNMKLSEKRAESAVQYIISKGIVAARINGKGFGETKILNRCTNGINCSEKEHTLNRRTEFRFYK